MTCLRKVPWLLVLLVASPSLAAELKIVLPQGRVAYQTNETIAVSVVRRDAQALPAANLTLTVSGADASKLVFTFPLPAVAAQGGPALATDHLALNANLLRPGRYTIEAAAHDAAAKAEIEVYSHIRKSTYRVVHWGSGAAREQQALMGEDGLGYNLLMNQQTPTEHLVRGGLDFMGNCLMGGMHQHDGRTECDWSDPYVTGGAVQRAMVRTYPWRTWGNAIGAHLHDEPGLTWGKHPHTGKFSPHDIAEQRAAYKRAFGEDAVWFDEVKPDDAASLERWMRISDFKLGFMEAFWRQARYAFDKMKPGFLSVTQSQYAWYALTDGYYFNVARSLPVICGHGGYDDYSLRTLNPAWFLEFSLPRQMDKPTWYLPEWFDMTSENWRAEHYTCFATGIQGLCTPPQTPWDATRQHCTDGIIETNKVMARLGTIFARPAITRAEVAILYSKSAAFYALAKNKADRDNEQYEKQAQVYLATKTTQYPVTVVLDEDIVDGTLAASHKAVVVTGIHYLDPAVKAGLEGFAAAGGLVLVTDDCPVAIAGATKLGARNESYPADAKKRLEKVQDDKKKKEESTRLYLLKNWLPAVQPVAKAMKAALVKRGIKPALETSAAGIAAGRQVRGEIEYLFAINFTPTDDAASPVKATEAAIALPLDGRAAYDAVRGGPFAELDKSGKGAFRFGGGQMRVFALTARPIGGVQVSAPAVVADASREADPVAVEIAAALVDAKGGALLGDAPMRVLVIDPLGAVRYDLYRAAERGVLRLALPLAANDPAGQWKVTVRELLNNTEATGAFAYRPPAVCGAAAGAARRAMMFRPDRKPIYDLFQSHRAFTIVRGTGDDVAAAAQRLAEILKPYDVVCTIVDAAAVKTRQLTPEETRTWTSYGGGAGNSPLTNGYDLPGPAILIGNSQNNPLIATVAQAGKWHPDMAGLMPYAVGEFVPGPGHGMIGWHLYPIGRRLETVTLLAGDAAGLAEAVGTLFEIVAGMEPLTPLALPLTSSVVAATALPPAPPQATVAWQTLLPDRAAAIKADGDKIVASSIDGSLTTIDAKGKIVSQKAGPAAVVPAPPAVDVKALPREKMPANRLPKFVAAGDQATAIGYWGGTLQVFDKDWNVKAQQQLPQDFAAMIWQGKRLIVGLADGTVVALDAGK